MSSSPKPYDHQLWLKRVQFSARVAGAIIICSLAIGVVGYHILGGLSWVDSLLEASMILGGMGPVAEMKTDAVKVFASIYALFSGLILIGAMGIFLSPWVHRLIHYPNHREERAAALKRADKRKS